VTALQDRLTAALAPRYIVQRELGQGGMATVFLARDAAIDRDVAIKVLHPDLALAVGADRFRREIDIASRLQHPHILALYDSGEAANSLYYVMPYLSGESLRDRMDRERQLGVDEAVRLACEVASALGFAHARGVVHRDIKPENVLLDDGHAVVADFGIAHAVSASGEQKLTQTGVTLGTPTYMSPEQAFAEKTIDGRSDIYSLACVLYEMLVGQPPFTGPNAQAIMARHSMEQVPSLTIVRESVPEHVEEAVFRALAKTPADRFATAEEFIEALRTPGGRTGTRRVQRLGEVDRRRRRVRRAIYSAAAAVPLLGAAAGAYVYLRPATGTAMTAESAMRARKVAVLYFEDGSRDSSLASVADGLTEALIGQLERVEQLDVVSENGVHPLRGSELEADSIGKLLDVGTIVRGEVDRSGDSTVRVKVRLIEAESGVDLKRATFSEPAANVLALQDSLAEQVALFLRERIGAEVQLRKTRAGTGNAQAWVLLQQAERARRDAEAAAAAGDVKLATSRLEAADSLAAAAQALDARWAAPAVSRGFSALRYGRIDQDPAFLAPWLTKAIEHADQALKLDPRNADALELRGTARYIRIQFGLVPDEGERNALLSGAEADLRAATALEPSQAGAWNMLSVLNYAKPNVSEANSAARRAYEADAYLSNAPAILWRLYVTAYDLEQFQDAIHWCDVGRQRFPKDPQFVNCQLWMFTTKARKPDPDEAWRLAAEYERLLPEQEREYGRREAQIVVAAALARAGLADSARRVLVSARANPDIDPRGELIGYEAVVRVQMGDKEEAVSLIQRYLAAHPEHRGGFTKVNAWWWRDLQSDPRFRAMVGLEPAAG
jgi:TolB-like protein/tRNA A-37 threonylcarbamoyl transferase component Bud32